MSTRLPEIGLGDLMKALEQIQPGAQAERERIAKCLGFQAGYFSNSMPDYRPTQGAGHSAQKNRLPTQPLPAPANKPVMPPKPEPAVELPKKILPFKLEILPNSLEAGMAPSLPPEVEQRDSLQLGHPNSPPVARLLLFSERKARGLLGAAVMQPAPGYDLDSKRLVRAFIQSQPVRKLPMLPRYSTRHGCQLLLDFSDALAPWWDDMRNLMRQFQSLLGEAVCPVYEFTRNPQEAVRWTETAGEQVWQAIPGKPVVVATDFGLTRIPLCEPRPGLSVWLEFAQHCRRQQVPLIALTPIERVRCPKELGRLMSLIHWNPATRAADVKRLINRKQRQAQ
jgi:hypothetical protein